MVRLNDRPDMTLDVYPGRKTTIQQQQQIYKDLLSLSSQEIDLTVINVWAEPEKLLFSSVCIDFL